MSDADYSKTEAIRIKNEVTLYNGVRNEIKLASGDHIDLKAYEPAMRHLIDTYISAEESEKISTFEDIALVEIIVKNGISSAIKKMPQNIRKNRGTSAEVIENNIRKLITEEKPTNPKYFEKMSILLKEIIKERKEKTIEYEEYLKKIDELCKKVTNQSSDTEYPDSIASRTKRVLYDNLDNNEKMALAVDEAIITNKPDGWRGNPIKEKTVYLAIKKALKKFDIQEDEKVKGILEIAKKQVDY